MAKKGKDEYWRPVRETEEIRGLRQHNKITHEEEVVRLLELGYNSDLVNAYARTDDQFAGGRWADLLGPDRFTIRLKPERTKEDRWTRYRAKVLEAIGLTDDEISSLKYNRLTNPRVAMFLRDIKDEVKRLGEEYGLDDYAAAAHFRREHFADLIDNGDISDKDPYFRMGYIYY